MINRKDFPFLKNKKLIYFDSAATALKPRAVILAEQKYYTDYATNVHRGLSVQAARTDTLYEHTRSLVASFIKANSEEIIFTSGATMSINLVVRTWGESNLRAGDIVLLSVAEHHANIIPWLQLQEKIGFTISYIPLRSNGDLDLNIAKKMLQDKRVKVLSVTNASNVLGIVFSLKKILKIARDREVTTIVDATLIAAHQAIDVRQLNCDFLFFSGHKIFGPTGTGILYGRKELLATMPPFFGGGAMMAEVNQESFISAESPAKFEAGTPNIAGVIALGAAIIYLNKLGWENIIKEENDLRDYFLRKIEDLEFVKLLGKKQSGRLPVFALALSDFHPHDVADLLGQQGIVVRAGHHCAAPLHKYLKVHSSLRVSLSFYNTKAEINAFIKALVKIHQQLT